MSTLCSCAMRRTSGDDLWRRSSSVDGSPSSVDRSRSAVVAGLRLPAAPDATSGWPAAASGSAGSEPRRGRRRCARRLAGAANHGDDAVDRDRLPFLDLDLGEHAGRRRRESRHRPCRSRSRTAARRDRPGSPTFLIQRTIVPSAIDSPIWGITTLVMVITPTSSSRQPVEQRVRSNRVCASPDGARWQLEAGSCQRYA